MKAFEWEHSRFLSFDVETSGELREYALQPWRVADGKAWLTSLVWAAFDGTKLDPRGAIFDTPTKRLMIPGMLREMLQHAIDNDLYILGWNVTFDIAWCLAYGLEELVFKVRWVDGMRLWRHLFIEPEYEYDRPDKRKSYRLKPDAMAAFMPVLEPYNEEINFNPEFHEDWEKLFKYNRRDTLLTFSICAVIWTQLWDNNPQRLKTALIEAECLPMFAKANLDGMVVDTLYAGSLGAKLDQVAENMLAVLGPDGVTEAIIRSPKQLGELLFDRWQLPVQKMNQSRLTGLTTRSTDKEVLHELAFLDPRVRQIKEYREALNNKAKFAVSPVASVRYNGDGRTHPEAICFGTYSGRLTYSSKQGKNKDAKPTGFALHQMKRGADYRDVIIAPMGYAILEVDAAGQEFKWMAIASRDPVMLELCKPGEDAHCYMGAMCAGKDYVQSMALYAAHDIMAERERQLGKVGNLSLQYRTSARKLRVVARVDHGIPMEMDLAKHIWITYRRAYQRVPDYWDEQIHITKHRGWVETFAGRRVQVVGDWEGDWGWSMGSTAINYRIQGTGADQKYLAMAVLKPYLVSISGYFAWDMHDGIYMYIPEAKLDQAAHDIHWLLQNLPYQKAWGFTPPIPLPWDMKTGFSWGGLSKYAFN